VSSGFFFFCDDTVSIGNQILVFKGQHSVLIFKGQNFQEKVGHCIISKQFGSTYLSTQHDIPEELNLDRHY